jgi:hypothetical protein
MSDHQNKRPRWDSGRGRGPPRNGDYGARDFHHRNGGSWGRNSNQDDDRRNFNQGGDRHCGGGGHANNIYVPRRDQYRWGPPTGSNPSGRDHASGNYQRPRQQGQDGVFGAHSAAWGDMHTNPNPSNPFLPRELSVAAARPVQTVVQTVEQWNALPSLREKIKAQVSFYFHQSNYTALKQLSMSNEMYAMIRYP